MTASATDAPELLYRPGPAVTDGARLVEFMAWLQTERGVAVDHYRALLNWSVENLDGFWSAVWDFFEVRASADYERVLGRRAMPGAEWFPGARLNYAEHCLRYEGAEQPALIASSQTRPDQTMTYAELRDQVRRVRAGLQRLGVGPGDRVAGYLPNVPETLVAFLATASLGAIWASCAPEFGARSVLDRFRQIEPTVLLAVPGYVYGDRPIDRTEEVAALRAGLPTVQHVVHVPYGSIGDIPDAVHWDALSAETECELTFEQVSFDTPLFVLFSSGTTGKPKAIVHGHGGILLEQLKSTGLMLDVRPGDRMQFFTTTAWMVWNMMISGLLVGATIILLDGDPMHPSSALQWQLAEKYRVTHLGGSPAWLMACRSAKMSPDVECNLPALRNLTSSGSPLPPDGFRWVYEQFGNRVLLSSTSGGTDVCSAFLGGSPLQPVYLGEMAGAFLGVAAHAFDAEGETVVGELGELVITQPMPSMPVGFWGDLDGHRYANTYFDVYPGVWRHGDWVRFSEEGTAVIAGRSDATLNRGGVRLGTSEFYRVVEHRPEVVDSLVVHLEDPSGGLGELVLFVRLEAHCELDQALRRSISTGLRTNLSPRHVPDRIEQVPAIPYTRTGKKLEVPVKRILLGAAVDTVATTDALADPTSLVAFTQYARTTGMT